MSQISNTQHPNLDYLQISNTFHVERILDYMTPNLPVCYLHQSRSIIFFCYLFAFVIDLVLIPPYQSQTSPFSLNTLLFPFIAAMFIHLLLAIIYSFSAFFERATLKTIFALLFLLHFPFVLFLFFGLIALSNQEAPDFKFVLSLCSFIGSLIDFLVGFFSRPSQKVLLSFEILSIFPSSFLFFLETQDLLHHRIIPFIPIFVFSLVYFFSIFLLTFFCRPCRTCMTSFLSDPEIEAEFSAATDGQLKQFKDQPYWGGNTDGLEFKKAKQKYYGNSIENRTKFPFQAEFQYYLLESRSDRKRDYIYLISPFPMLAFMSISIFLYLHLIYNFQNFIFIFAGFIFVLILSIFLNSRACACSFLSISNIDSQNAMILWDHPSLFAL